MSLQTVTLHMPFLLAQADTPAPTDSPTDSPVDLSLPTATPESTSYMTINGQPATAEQKAALAKFGVVGGLVGLLVALVFVAAVWKIFTKAGKPGWASIIPIYNAVVWLEIAGRPLWWLVLLLIPGVNLIILLIVLFDLCKSFGYGIGFFLGMLFLSPVFILIWGFGPSRYVGPGGRAAGAYPGGYPPAGYPPATL